MRRFQPTEVIRNGNRIEIRGSLGLYDFRRVLAAIHHATAKAGYEDLVLDFQSCEAAFAGPMLAICSTISSLRRQGIETEAELPAEPRLARLFLNAGWAHILDPSGHHESRFRGHARVPTIQFSSPTEQKVAVDRMMDAILSSLPQLARKDLAAIEWSVHEISDNVLVHSGSQVGGFVQLHKLSNRRQVEFSVADSGVGIPTTLREAHPELRADTETLDKAIREGVTRDRTLGQGNGLYGTFEICQVGSGYLHVHSGYARLDYHEELHIKSEQIPLAGTLVVASLDVSNPHTLAQALCFEGERYEPLDYVEVKFEREDREELLFKLQDEAASFGSRTAGTPVRTKLSNLVYMNPGRRVIVDFSGIPLISSSFADEVFGKLFMELGAIQFMRSLEFQGLADIVRALVDRAILQRARG